MTTTGATPRGVGSDEAGPLYRVVRSNGSDEFLAEAVNYKIAAAAYRAAAAMYPNDLIELKHGARVIEKSK